MVTTVPLEFTTKEILRFFKIWGYETFKPEESYLKKLYKLDGTGSIKDSYLWWVKDKNGNPVGPIEIVFPRMLKLGFTYSILFLNVEFDKEDYYDKPPKKGKSKKIKKFRK